MFAAIVPFVFGCIRWALLAMVFRQRTLPLVAGWLRWTIIGGGPAKNAVPGGVEAAHGLLLVTALLNDTLFTETTSGRVAVNTVCLSARKCCTKIHRNIRSTTGSSSMRMRLVRAGTRNSVSGRDAFISALITHGISTVVLSTISRGNDDHAIHHTDRTNVPIVYCGAYVGRGKISGCISTCLINSPLRFNGGLNGTTTSCFVTGGVSRPGVTIVGYRTFRIYIRQHGKFRRMLGSHIPNTRVITGRRKAILSGTVSINRGLVVSAPSLGTVVKRSNNTALNTMGTMHGRGRTKGVTIFNSSVAARVTRRLRGGRILGTIISVSNGGVNGTIFTRALGIVGGRTSNRGIVRIPVSLCAGARSNGR